jgi:photosystem II stability/assembly factor-like uncharacterized protein
MKTKIIKLFLLLTAIIVLGFGFNYINNNQPQSDVFNVNKMDGRSSPEVEKRYFEHLYEPYGYLTPEMRMEMAEEVNRLPSDNVNSVNSWVLWGPVGQRLFTDPGPGTNYYSGRILDIEVANTVGTRLATASGGLWGFVVIFPVPLSDNITSTLNIGSFATKPNDDNTIIVGTGEGAYNNGSGLYKTTNGGASYTNITIGSNPGSYFKIRFSPINSAVIYAATSTGFYKSFDVGSAWTNYQLTGRVTDIAIDPLSNNVYAPVWGDGLYKSTDAGITWTKLTAGGIPTTDWGRATVSLCASNPSVVYVNVSKNSDNLTLGVYKTTNAGTTWTNVTPAAEFHAYGWYNAACGVSPTDANRIIVGGLSLWRSTNGGTSWTQITNAHADQHVVTWNATGTQCWVGNDGGMFSSLDAGLTFNYNANLLPITQYYEFDVVPGGNFLYGGAQDNGISGTTNHGTSWYHFLGGDGGDASIDPSNTNRIMATNGLYGGSWLFQTLLTADGGATWNGVNTGLDPNTTQWFTRVGNDKIGPVYWYHSSGNFIYKSTNDGTNWSKLNGTNAFPSEVEDMTVASYNAAGTVVWACLNTTATKLEVFDGGSFQVRQTGLPTAKVQHVAIHPTNDNVAYAVMNGVGTPGQKLYKTNDRGVSWTNVSGDLPNVSLTAMIPHPTDNNLLYVGSTMGCYKSTNGGTTWARWNNGMANATQVSEMGYIDSIAANFKYYIVTATFGRSIYYRDISGDDPIGISNHQNGIPKSYELMQNYPNPFNPTTKIKFVLPVNDNVKLEIFNILGQKVAAILDQNMKAGIHDVEFNASNLPSGVYFYRLTTSKLVDTKKMILVK